MLNFCTLKYFNYFLFLLLFVSIKKIDIFKLDYNVLNIKTSFLKTIQKNIIFI
jgi:hypothetical protein